MVKGIHNKVCKKVLTKRVGYTLSFCTRLILFLVQITRYNLYLGMYLALFLSFLRQNRVRQDQCAKLCVYLQSYKFLGQRKSDYLRLPSRFLLTFVMLLNLYNSNIIELTLYQNVLQANRNYFRHEKVCYVQIVCYIYIYVLNFFQVQGGIYVHFNLYENSYKKMTFLVALFLQSFSLIFFSNLFSVK
eukprot:TRINITY_DN21794_c0_g1_i1.p2 TRINITY_DN21794_c0_g1~~TRINITY_DN21794_c0_g1_i1.p2  ORF type:complete len:208 (+),score=-14.14 TRINITY_DN21794_c0_g1_i1:61-624(+)